MTSLAGVHLRASPKVMPMWGPSRIWPGSGLVIRCPRPGFTVLALGPRWVAYYYYYYILFIIRKFRVTSFGVCPPLPPRRCSCCLYADVGMKVSGSGWMGKCCCYFVCHLCRCIIGADMRQSLRQKYNLKEEPCSE